MGEQLADLAWVRTAEWLLFTLLALALLMIVAVAVRRYVLGRGGAVECYLRSRTTDRPSPWRIGFGRYGTDELRWYRTFSLRPRPAAELSRRGLVVMGRRAPTTEELSQLTTDLVVVGIGWTGTDGSTPEEPVYEIAMTEGVLTGFLSWSESMPPGTIWES